LRFQAGDLKFDFFPAFSACSAGKFFNGD
jgi:hypothetical protein